jgi:hypothetical protein
LSALRQLSRNGKPNNASPNDNRVKVSSHI